jgi:hypothetical protein
MVISTQSAVLVPVPPACVTDLQARIDQANWQKEQDALIQEQLIEYFRDELPGLVEQKGLWNVVDQIVQIRSEPARLSTNTTLWKVILLYSPGYWL